LEMVSADRGEGEHPEQHHQDEQQAFVSQRHWMSAAPSSPPQYRGARDRQCQRQQNQEQ
jgi:hypothetical protein